MIKFFLKGILFGIFVVQPFFQINAQCIDEANVYSFTFNGHSYEIVKESKTWANAVNCAVSRGGYLAEINDVEEHNALFDEINNNAGINISETENDFGTAAIWIGGSDAATEGNWIWDGNNDGNGDQFWSGGINGSAVGGAYTNWGVDPPEPDNSGDQDKLTLTIASWHPNFGKWNDLAASDDVFFVVEYNTILNIASHGPQDINTIILSPNPTNDVVTINNTASSRITSLTVINASGELIEQKNELSVRTISLDVSQYSSGVYFVKIIDSSHKMTQYKFVVK